MIEVIAITQLEAGESTAYPLGFFNTLDDAQAALKLIGEVAQSNQTYDVLHTDAEWLVVCRYNPMLNTSLMLDIQIKRLPLAEAFNLMRLVRPAITPMHYLVSNDERPAL
jgi:hypothetical protein